MRRFGFICGELDLFAQIQICLRKIRFICANPNLFAQPQFHPHQSNCPNPNPQYEKALAAAKASLKPLEFFAARKTSAVALESGREGDKLLPGWTSFPGTDMLFPEKWIYYPELLKYYPENENTIRTPKAQEKCQSREQRGWHLDL